MTVRVHFPVVPGRGHNLYLEQIEEPPEGVTYTFPAPHQTGYREARDEKPSLMSRVRGAQVFRTFYTPFLQHVMGGMGVAERLRRLREPDPGFDLYHSVGGIHPFPDPWVVSFESALDFFGFGQGWDVEIERPLSRRYVRRKLLSPHCKRILPWTEAARRSVLGTFPGDREALDAKMEVIPLAIRAGEEPAPAKEGTATSLLFVGSRNFPRDFLAKGGHVVLQAFEKLRKRYDVELTIRAGIPEPYASRYRDLDGLHVIDRFLSDEEMRGLYEDADVFLFPGAQTPGMVILEAMRAGRPVVTFDVWANREIVAGGETGLVVQPVDDVTYLSRWKTPMWGYKPEFIEPYERNAAGAVERVVEATARLIEDGALRRRMGERARREVAEGRFSIARRNEALGRVYREALEGLPSPR